MAKQAVAANMSHSGIVLVPPRVVEVLEIILPADFDTVTLK